jgi:hypothetical protein
MLHDLRVALSGDPATRKHPAHTMSSKILGGFLAYNSNLHVINHPSIDNAFVGDTVQGVVLHIPTIDMATPPQLQFCSISPHFSMSLVGTPSVRIFSLVLDKGDDCRD